jgi:hypothetical protein
MTTTTLFTAHRPIADYLRLAHTEPAAVPLRALDTFTLRQLASFYPVPTTMIDLAADATGGASAVLWAANPNLFHRIFVPPPTDGAGNWRATFPDTLALLGHTDGAAALNLTDALAALTPTLNPLSPPLFLLAPRAQTTATVVAEAEPLLAAHPRAVVALLGLERRLAVAATLADAGYHAVDGREVSPIFKASALTFAAREATPATVLRRVGQLFAGNFNHNTLPDHITTLRQKLAAIQPLITDPDADPTEDTSA